jgi:hypothetical protein
MQQPLGKLDGGDYENLRHKRSLGQQSLPRDFPNANMSPEYKDSCTKLGFFFFWLAFVLFLQIVKMFPEIEEWLKNL